MGNWVANACFCQMIGFLFSHLTNICQWSTFVFDYYVTDN